MTSMRPPAKPFYGPINPAILGGFEWEDEEPTQDQEQPATISTRATGPSLLRYLPFNPALLGGFDDDEQRVTPGGSNRVEKVREDATPAATTQAPPLLRRSRWFLARAIPSAVENVETWRRGVTGQDAAQDAPRSETSTTQTEPDTSNNPYRASIKDRQNPVESTAPANVSESLFPDELRCV
jgi:hypothetical protein